MPSHPLSKRNRIRKLISKKISVVNKVHFSYWKAELSTLFLSLS